MMKIQINDGGNICSVCIWSISDFSHWSQCGEIEKREKKIWIFKCLRNEMFILAFSLSKLSWTRQKAKNHREIDEERRGADLCAKICASIQSYDLNIIFFSFLFARFWQCVWEKWNLQMAIEDSLAFVCSLIRMHEVIVIGLNFRLLFLIKWLVISLSLLFCPN